MLTAKQLRQGSIIMFKGAIHVVVGSDHHKPGKGGAVVRAKLKNLSSGIMINETMRPEDTFEEVYIEQKPMQYLYRDDIGFCFMDEASYEQVHIQEEVVGSAVDYLVENMTVNVNFHDGKILGVVLPVHVVLEIAETEPGFKGDTVSGCTKSATLETGKAVKVPLFVNKGDRVKVDTRTGEYVGRA